MGSPLQLPLGGVTIAVNSAQLLSPLGELEGATLSPLGESEGALGETEGGSKTPYGRTDLHKVKSLPVSRVEADSILQPYRSICFYGLSSLWLFIA